jgi:hypothetical protein
MSIFLSQAGGLCGVAGAVDKHVFFGGEHQLLMGRRANPVFDGETDAGPSWTHAVTLHDLHAMFGVRMWVLLEA